MHKTRLLIAALLFCAYCAALGILWLEHLGIQVLALATTLALCLLRVGVVRTFKQLRLIAPFALSLAIVYGLVIILGVAPGGENAFQYWLRYGLGRLLLLISSLLAFRVCVSLLSYEGLLRATPNIHWQKYLILGRVLYEASFRSFPQLRYWQELIPGSGGRGLKFHFYKALAASLALALFVMEEARRKGEMIDNRIEHCHKELS